MDTMRATMMPSPSPKFSSRSSVLIIAAAAFFGSLIGAITPVQAQSIANPIAVFDGLDKVTAVITTFEVPIDSVGTFGALRIRPRVCYTKPVTEAPQTTSFVEIEESQLTGGQKRIFTGWMFASSPGIHGVEHPVYDVWLKTCKTSPGSVTEGILKKSP